MAADSVTVLMLYVQFANLLMSAYLVKVLFSALGHKGAFSKTMKIMLAAVLLFFAAEMAQVLLVVTGPEAGLIQSAFILSFLILLLAATIQIKRGVQAHEHLVRHRHKGRLSDVE